MEEGPAQCLDRACRCNAAASAQVAVRLGGLSAGLTALDASVTNVSRRRPTRSATCKTSIGSRGKLGLKPSDLEEVDG